MMKTEKRAVLMRLLSAMEKVRWTLWDEDGQPRECVYYEAMVEAIVKESDRE